MSNRRPTIRDVARKSGLSVSTVSLVLNEKSNVAKETRQKVQKVIADLNYHPQRSARGLASKSSGNIGFILTDDHFNVAEPFYTRVFLGTEFEARKHNYYVLLTTVAPTVRATKEMPRFLLEHNVDGVIIAGKIGTPWIQYVRDRSLPIVLIDYEIPRHRLSTVTMDNRDGARLVVEHLLELGHTKIGFIGGDLDHPSIAERYHAYCDNLQSRGVEITSAWKSINEPDTCMENGYRAAKGILAPAARRPSAIFAANDAMALGCMKYCKDVGISVPDSVAIVGFDNIEAGLLVQPRLTTVNVHREEMGAMAVRHLVEMMRDKNDVMVKTTTPVELVIRESSGAKRDLHSETPPHFVPDAETSIIVPS
ncbi:MAG: LacI family DNA-binding transcriptional regulator [Ignavibacteria bacterium]|nr:LacI family DNA-binding transcriptional regulator [Ignavibacteria bacterium]